MQVIATTVKPFDLKHQSGMFNSYTIGTSGLPDIYTRSMRAADRAKSVHIRQTTSAHGITNM